MNLCPVLGIVLIVVVLVVLALSLGLGSYAMTGKRQTLEEAYNWQKDHYDISFYDAAEKDNYIIIGDGGYELHAQLVKNPENTGKYMIISHGYTDNHIGDLKYLKMYLDYGYNCVIYDLRGHGENRRFCTTFGDLESLDLLKVIEDTRVRYPDVKELGLHGESLGAATTVTVLKYKPRVDFAVADCPFADIENVMRGALIAGGMPGFFFNFADLGARLRFGHSLKKMRPIDSLAENDIPILFIHGGKDDFILPSNSERMRKKTRGYSEMYIIDEAPHAVSILTDPESYREYVREFLEKVRR